MLLRSEKLSLRFLLTEYCLAKHIVNQKSAHFEPEKFEDHYEAALIDLINKKQAGHPLAQLAGPAPLSTAGVGAGKSIPDPSLILILSDINMPGMSGLEILPKLKLERPSVPVIMITAYGDDATRKKATELGAAGLLSKPIDFDSLRQEIDQRLIRAA